MAWTSVKETLPNVGDKVLVCDVYGDCEVGIFEYDRGPLFTIWDGEYCMEATHWMPLPEIIEVTDDE